MLDCRMVEILPCCKKESFHVAQYTYLTLFTLSYCRAVEQLADGICGRLADGIYEKMSRGTAEDKDQNLVTDEY